MDVEFYPEFLTPEESLPLFDFLHTLPDVNTKIRTNFSIGDVDYGEKKSKSFDCFPEVYAVKQKLDQLYKVNYNVCIVNYYPNGSIGIAHHKDRELSLGTHICGISLGATRTLQLKRYDNEYNISLPDGSLYVIKGVTNQFWSHSILKDSTEDPRISLTFRNNVVDRSKLIKNSDIDETIKIKFQDGDRF